MDRLCFLEVSQNSVIEKDVIMLSPWLFSEKLKKPFSAKENPLVVAITHRGNKKKAADQKFMLYDPYFFSMSELSIWGPTAKSYDSYEIPLEWKKGIAHCPIWILSRKSKKFGFWQEEVAELKNDAIIMGTEAGVNILLYWNGTTYEVHWPPPEY